MNGLGGPTATKEAFLKEASIFILSPCPHIVKYSKAHPPSPKASGNRGQCSLFQKLSVQVQEMTINYIKYKGGPASNHHMG